MSAVPEIGPASEPHPKPSPALARAGVRRRPLGASLVVGGVLVALIVLMALVSYVWTPWDPTFVNAADRLQGFSSRHWLGTDKFGRDVFSQILMGARTTLFVGVVAVGVAAIIGVPLGIVAAMAARWTGEALMRGNDLLLAFPALLLAIMFSAIYGGSTLVAMVAIGIATVPSFVRLVRSGSLQVMRSERPGRPGRRAETVRHRAEARAAQRRALIIVQASVAFAIAVLAEAALSFLGLGTPPPTPSWGRMLQESQELLFIAPRLCIIPGIAIAIAVLGFNLLGDGLRDYLDRVWTTADDHGPDGLLRRRRHRRAWPGRAGGGCGPRLRRDLLRRARRAGGADRRVRFRQVADRPVPARPAARGSRRHWFGAAARTRPRDRRASDTRCPACGVATSPWCSRSP